MSLDGGPPDEAFLRDLLAALHAARDGVPHPRLDPGREGLTGGLALAVNSLVDGLVHPTNEVARVISAVAHGDLGG